MLSDRELRSVCATNNYRRIEAHFQLKDQLAAYVELYREAVLKSGPLAKERRQEN